MKKLSISGLLLMIVSAVVAGIVPSKKSVNDYRAVGHVENTDGNGHTCVIGAGVTACSTTNTAAGEDDTENGVVDSDTETNAVDVTASDATLSL